VRPRTRSRSSAGGSLACGTESGIAPSTTDVRFALPHGYAHDAAFHFYYEENLRLLREAGAMLVPFSPIRDGAVLQVDGLYLGGGYPEVHAEALAANTSMRDSIRAFAQTGGPVYAECSDLMYLCSGIRLLNGSFYPMVGLFSAEALMHDRLQALGYVEATTSGRSVLGPAGQQYRGHQFRYSELRGLPDTTTRSLTLHQRRSGATMEEVYSHGQNVLASYVHGHWASLPEIPIHFVEACVAHAATRPGSTARRPPRAGTHHEQGELQ